MEWTVLKIGAAFVALGDPNGKGLVVEILGTKPPLAIGETVTQIDGRHFECAGGQQFRAILQRTKLTADQASDWV